MLSPLSDLPPYIYGTTRLGDETVPREQRVEIAERAVETVGWMHTSRQYDNAIELLGQIFAEHPQRIPELVVKIGGGTADDVRATIAANIGPLGVATVTLGQLSPVEELEHDLVAGGSALDGLRRIRGEGLVGRYVLEIFPWTSDAPLAALRAGHLDDLIDGYILYLNPLQRFASNELWDELLDRNSAIISMRTVGGGPVHMLRDVPGAAWRPYLQERAVEVAPIFERSGISSWAEFCMRFAHSTPQVMSTVGSASRIANLDELVDTSKRLEPLEGGIIDELFALQRRWSDEVDVLAEPWTM